jgi:hypothetical protein
MASGTQEADTRTDHDNETIRKGPMPQTNRLFYGDNLDVLRRYVKDDHR